MSQVEMPFFHWSKTAEQKTASFKKTYYYRLFIDFHIGHLLFREANVEHDKHSL